MRLYTHFPFRLFFLLIFSFLFCLVAGPGSVYGPYSASDKDGVPPEVRSGWGWWRLRLPSEADLAKRHEKHAQDMPLKGIVIVLDAGHGGHDPGATYDDVKESDVTLGIVLELKKRLEEDGAKVVLTRHDDTEIDLEPRTRLSNKVRPDIFVSVHINASPNPDSDGIETYYYSPKSRKLAAMLFHQLVRDLGAKPNWVHRRDLYVCKFTEAPAVLAEVGFISNQAKREKLARPGYQHMIALSLEEGIVQYFKQARRR